jgi:hypothetical protein
MMLMKKAMWAAARWQSLGRLSKGEKDHLSSTVK